MSSSDESYAQESEACIRILSSASCDNEKFAALMTVL